MRKQTRGVLEFVYFPILEEKDFSLIERIASFISAEMDSFLIECIEKL